MSPNLQNLAVGLAANLKKDPRRRMRASIHLSVKSPKSGTRRKPLVLFSALFILLTLLAFRVSAQPPARTDSATPTPLLFEPFNASGSPVRYLGRAARYTLFIADDEADVVLQEEKAPSQKLQRGGRIVVEAHASLLRMCFVDANLPTSIIPADRQSRPRAPFTAVAYRGLYPGTDIILRGDQQRMQFQVNLGPGAAVSAENIVIELIGATSVSLDANGNAIVRSGHASLLLQRPVISVGNPSLGNGPSTVGSFRIENHNRLRFIIDSAALTLHPRTA